MNIFFFQIKYFVLQEENNNNVVTTGNKNHAAVALLQELQRTNASKKLNITTANPLLAGITLTQMYLKIISNSVKLKT